MSLFGGASLPRSRLFGSDVRAAQSSGEWPGFRVTCRESFGVVAVMLLGTKAAVESALVGGTRRDDAAEGGGRRGASVRGLGGGGIKLDVEALSLGGLWWAFWAGEGTGLLKESGGRGDRASVVAKIRDSPGGESLFFCSSTFMIDIDGDLSARH